MLDATAMDCQGCGVQEHKVGVVSWRTVMGTGFGL